MKILICGDHPTTTGGIARVMATLDDWLQIQPRQVPSIDYIFIDPRGREKWTWVSMVLAMLRIAGYVLRGVDLIHLNTAPRGSIYRNILIALLARCRRTPYVVHLHAGGFHLHYEAMSSLLKYLVRRYFSGAAHIIALTPSWKEYVVRELAILQAKITVVPNGTAHPSPALLETKPHLIPTFVYAGRLSEVKGVPMLLEVFGRLSSTVDARLVLLGGSADDRTRQAIELNPRGVVAHGWVDNEQTMSEMAQAWALVLPSSRENMPMCVLEAMSVGTAVVATNIMGLTDMVNDGVEGLLVEPESPDELLDALLRLSRDQSRTTSLGARGRKRWVEEYRGDVMAGRLVEVWKCVLD